MPRYYFDIRKGRDFELDEEGLELPTLQAAQKEAAGSLADMARDAMRKDHDGAGHQTAIEVRDDNGPVLQAKFMFELERHNQ